ncbi:hypothetical protein [Winogradskyella bathintestinalis]|uniref:Uncharacterized protein n=1 Tax=Winogradskyella bathintestinalis TaxID=3035208 RepID=A0ABT7ZRV2_9FLAO|nr:hypothetical protein [Winogradskyella bathintestinalis]MDN3491730.1 hypothetical protein [Winogradskyella bathintestinalis]
MLYSKQPIDTIKQKNDNFYVLIRGSQNYDIIITTIEKEDYEEAKQLKPAKLLNSAVIPTQVNITENCYTVTTSIETVRNCLEDDEQLISISYLGFIEKLNSCVLYENWFESTISNLLINLDDGSTSYISGYELIFSPNLKFIYSYANDGIDFDGISLHQMIDKKAHPILVTDYDMEEKYKFNFSSFGKAYWVSDTSFYASNGDAYYKFEIQDKRITYRNEFQENSIHSENSKFTIKIDKLKDGTLRYMSWNKPNTTSDRPSLVLYNGAIEQQNKYGLGYDYRFENGEYLYLIENNISTTSSKRVILKLYIDNEEKLNSTMKDLTILK